jgi:hypothetical protein
MNMNQRIARTFGLLLVAMLAVGPVVSATGQDRIATATRTPARSPVLICTSTLHLEPGRAGPEPATPPVRITMRYRAVSLGTETLEAIRTDSRVRAFFNGRVLRRLVQFTTDVPLTLGEARLKPGTYDAGFTAQGEGRWRFVVLDHAGKTQLSEPLTVTRGEAMIPALNLSLLPAGKPDHFLLAARYGTLRGTLGLTRVRS